MCITSEGKMTIVEMIWYDPGHFIVGVWLLILTIWMARISKKN